LFYGDDAADAATEGPQDHPSNRLRRTPMKIDRRQLLATLAATVAIPTLAFGAKPEAPKKPQYVMFVKDMHCATCAKRVAAKLYAVPGVVKVATNIEKNFVVVVPQSKKQLSPKKIWEATVAAKLTPVKLVSPIGSFTEVPKT
jgi:Cu+-exporting ATPase